MTKLHKVTYVSLRLVDAFGIITLYVIYIFVPISINISNSITYTVVSINISFLFDKHFVEMPLSKDMHKECSSSMLFSTIYPERTIFKCLSV